MDKMWPHANSVAIAIQGIFEVHGRLMGICTYIWTLHSDLMIEAGLISVT